MNHQEHQNAIVRQLFEACREQPQSIQQIRSLVLRHSNDDDRAADQEQERLSLTAGSDAPRDMQRRERRTSRRLPSSQARDENGLTPLSVACLYGASLEVIHFLATQQMLHQHSRQIDIDNRHIDDDANYYDDDDNVHENIDNCLQYACFAGASNDVISYLLQFDPKAVEMTDCTGQLALHAACCSPSNTGVSLAVVHSLIRHYPRAVTMVDHKGRTPLHHACSNPGISLPVIQCLVRHYANAVKIRDENEMLPLHRACWYRVPLDVVDFLVHQYPQALQCPDQDGELPLHLACLSTTAMTTTTTEMTRSDTALQTVMSLLLKHYPLAKLQRNVSGYLPLELVSEKLTNAVQVLQLLTPSGWPPLHFACAQGCSMRTMSRLLELFPKKEPSSSTSLPPSTLLKAQVTTNDPTLLPLLFYACQGPRANLNLVQLLMEYSPQGILETSRQTGDTVLHHVCRHGTHVNIVELLVQCHPAAVTIKNHQGFIPLDLALMMHAIENDDAQQQHSSLSSSTPPTLDVLYFLVRNYPNHILSYS
jgi:ankyrin repeat protein